MKPGKRVLVCEAYAQAIGISGTVVRQNTISPDMWWVDLDVPHKLCSTYYNDNQVCADADACLELP